LRAQGDEIAALTRERENELKALDSVSAAIQRQIYALEDWQKTVTDAESAVAQAEADLRRAYDIERDRLLGVVGAVADAQAALRSAYEAEAARLREIIGGVEAARQTLRAAYERERSAIEETVSGVQSMVDSLRTFRRELDLNPLAQGSALRHGPRGRDARGTGYQAARASSTPPAPAAPCLDASMASDPDLAGLSARPGHRSPGP